MKKIFLTITLSLIAFSVIFSAEKGSIKVEKGQKVLRKVESEPTFYNDGVASSKPVIHNTENRENQTTITLVDSSTNGFGMVSSATRPLIVTEDENWFVTYRQYAGLNTTHGQLGGAFSGDGVEWDVYNNLNSNGNPPWGGGGFGGTSVAQARYPSAVGNDEKPFAVWTEYTANTTFGSLYGGRPYYTYDQFGWDTGGFVYPYELDILWETDAKDLWVGSASMVYDEDSDTYVAVSSFQDWTRDNNYVFTSEAYEDGFMVFSEESVLIDEQVCLVAGTADGSYQTPIHLNINDDGVGVAGLIGLFAGCDPDYLTGSPYTDGCYHIPIFKMTTDFGRTWSGNPDVCGEGGGLFYVPDAVFTDIINNHFPEAYEGDECTGEEYSDIIDFWSYYDADFKVDADGNVHILMSMLPSDDEFSYYIEKAGWYHFTIDSEYLLNPGPVNTSTGWNWSMVVDASDTWIFQDNNANSYLNNTQASLSFSRDNSDIVWVVADLMTDYCGELFDDGGTPEDPCDDLFSYDRLSEDIYIFKSEDGGVTWSNAYNATQTEDDPSEYPASWNGECPAGLNICGPEETYPHAAPWSTDDAVFYFFQMPNYGFNEIGTFEQADFMNRVYAGITEMDEFPADTYPQECGDACNALGDANGDDISDVLDIIAIVGHILGTMPIADELSLCGADLDENGIVDVLDIIGIVNGILGNRGEAATSATFTRTDSGLEMSANGVVDAVQMTLTHDDDFKIELNESISELNIVAASDSKNNETTLIAVAPRNGEIARISGEYAIKEDGLFVANENGYIATSVPSEFVLMDSYPNPFNPSTTISFDLNGNSNIDLSIYNTVGQKVATLVNGYKEIGSYDIQWNGTDDTGAGLASGMYLVKLTTDNGMVTNKITLLK